MATCCQVSRENSTPDLSCEYDQSCCVAQANLAMRKIQDSIRFEGLDKEWRAKQRRVRPCIKRKMEAKESRKKIIQAQFREQIQAILSRKSRCVHNDQRHTASVLCNLLADSSTSPRLASSSCCCADPYEACKLMIKAHLSGICKLGRH